MREFDISKIIESLKSSFGQDFLKTIAQELHQAIHADHTFIARINPQKTSSKTLVYIDELGFQENFKYSLAHTPCSDVSDDDTCVYPAGVCEQYPNDELLKEMGIEGYIGSPLHSSHGNVIGIVVAMYHTKIEEPRNISALFELFSGRIAAEIERIENEQELQALNERLEKQVAARTSELQATIEQLTLSQQQIVQQEKLASLGQVVSGVAHEVNTPVGVAVLASSTMKSHLASLDERLKGANLSKSFMTTFLSNMCKAQSSIDFSLEKISTLVGHFKKMAVESYFDEPEELKLGNWLTTMVMSLRPLLADTGIELTISTPPEDIKTTIYPARLSQVLTNIVANSVTHGFSPTSENDAKRINIELRGGSDSYHIIVTDNGLGMDEEIKQKIFEPFFTTKRHAGGIGLGMTVVSNLVSKSLRGTVDVESSPNQGTVVALSFTT